MIAKLWSINALSVELGINRTTLGKRLENLEPDSEEKVGNRTERRWKMKRVFEHLSDSDENPFAAKARLDTLRGDKVEIEIAEKTGELVSVEQVSDLWVRRITNLKTRLLAIPTKAAPMLVVCKTKPKIKAKLEKIIDDTLKDIANSEPLAGIGFVNADGNDTAAKTDSKPMGRPRKKTKRRK